MSLLKSLLSKGVLPHHDVFEVRTVRAVNALGANAIICLLFAAVYGYLINGNNSSLYSLAALPFFIIVIILNIKNKSLLAISVLFITSAFTLTIYSIYHGEEAFIHSLFILNIIGLALLYRKGKAKVHFYVILSVTLLCIVFVLVSFQLNLFTEFRSPSSDPLAERRLNFFFLLVCSILFSLVVVISYNQQQKVTEASLYEQRVLLAEVNHRVKNNLAIIISLLNLQKNANSNPETQEALQDVHDRIMSMAIVHNKMYNSKSTSSIDMASYILELIGEIHQSLDINKNIEFITDIETLNLEVQVTIPLGLIINELVTNAIKHAFTDIQRPIIKISLKQKGDDFYELIVEDNGVGTTKDLLNENGGLGLNLIESLAEQIEAKCFFETNQGLKFFLLIPVKKVGLRTF